MKNVKKTTSSFFLLCLFMLNTNAQNEDYKSTITLDAGFSLVGAIFNATTINGEDPSSSALPAFQITYDYGLQNWISLGAAVSFQSMSVDAVTFDNSSNTITYTDNVRRLNLALRALVHYANDGNVDLYSGLRFGVTNWSGSSDNPNNEYDLYDYWGISTNFAPQLVLFGIRGYFTDNIGANAELTIGAPYFFALGLAYRL